MDEIEVLKLKQQNLLLQAQALERDILVREHARLMGEVQELQRTISKLEEEVRRYADIEDFNIVPVSPDPIIE